MKKRFLSLALSAALTLSVLTPAALAAEYVELVPPKYDAIGELLNSSTLHYSDGLAVVILDGKWGFIDTNGKEVVPPKYDRANSFYGGLAKVVVGEYPNTKCGYIDTTGKEVIPLQYKYADSFSEGLAAVNLNGKYGFIDTTGKEVVPPKYDYADYFSEGLAAIAMNGKWGFIDTTGKEVVPPKYDQVGEPDFLKANYFYDGLVKVVLDEKVGYINTTGKEVIPCQYDSVVFSSEGLAVVTLDSKYGVVDTNGRVVVPCQYDSASFYDGLVKVILNGKTSYFDKTGKEVALPTKEDVISPSVRDKYDSVGYFSEGLAAVGVGKYPNTKYGFIDTTGKEVVSPKYDSVDSFSEGLAAVRLDGKWGFIDATGKEVIPCQYDSCGSVSGGFVQVKSDGKWGIVDTNGRVIVPCQYSYIETTNVDGLMVVQDENEKCGLIRISTSAPVNPTPAPTVPPSHCAVTLNGKAITLNAYLFTENGGGSNYVMLRDIAMLLNGTKAQFDVSWAADTGISITTGSAYTPVGGELQGKGDGEKSYTANSSTITVDGKPVSLGGYTIESNNYFKLRDLGTALGFTVDWDAATGTVVLSTNG